MPDAKQEHDETRDGALPVERAQRPISAAARRALDEAAARSRSAHHDARPAEKGGRGGLEPVRFGDWEVKGLASDF